MVAPRRAVAAGLAAMAATFALHAAAPLVHAAAAGSSGSGDARLEALRERTASSISGLVRLTSTNYTRLAIEGPRPYGLLVQFTAVDPKYGCTQCGPAQKEMAVAARSLARAYPDVATRDVFVAVTDFANNMDAFAMHGLTSVPHIAYFPPSGAAYTPASSKEPVSIPRSNMLSPSDGPVDAGAVLALAGRGDLTVARSPSERQGWSALIAVACAVAAVLVSADPANLAFFRRPGFWVAVCLGVYAFSISGAVSCIIKQPPWYTLGRDGKPAVFVKEGGEQTVLEGAVIGLLNLLAAGAIIAVVRAGKSRAPADTEFTKLLVGALAVGLFAAAYLRILSHYQDKTPWYSASKLVPADVARLTRVAKKWAVDAAAAYAGLNLKPYLG
jgi:hypothetical protein